MSSQPTRQTVYTGSEVNVQYLQSLLEEAAISSTVRNEFQSGLRAGFGGGIPPGQVNLLVRTEDFEEAQKIANETFPNEEN